MTDTNETQRVRTGFVTGVGLARTEEGDPVFVLALEDGEGQFSTNITSNEVLAALIQQLSPGAVQLRFVVNNANPTLGVALVQYGPVQPAE